MEPAANFHEQTSFPAKTRRSNPESGYLFFFLPGVAGEQGEQSLFGRFFME